jgi:hypothetical protein
MFDSTNPDFTPLYEKARKLPVLMPHQLIDEDQVITHGTGEYSVGARQRRAERLKADPNTMTTY